MDYIIANPQGKWFKNTGRYGFTDPESATHFPAGATVKATETEWLKGQPIFVEADDPTVTTASQEPAKEPEKQPEKPPAGDTGKKA